MRELDQVALTVGVNPEYLRLLQRRETGGIEDPHAAVSDAGALGALQVMPLTGKAMADKYDLDFSTPEGRVEAGARYYKELLDEFEDPAVAAAAYHSGPTTVRKIVNSGGDLATDLGPVGSDYYSWFNERTPKAEKEVTMPEYKEGDIKIGEDSGKKFRLDVVEGKWKWQEVDEPQFPGLQGAGLSAAPAIDQAIEWLPGDPSILSLLEHAPGVMSAIGAPVGFAATGGNPYGGVAGASIGAGGGESIRQAVRKAAGYVPATGNVAEMMGLDPSSKAASVVGIGTEMALGAGGESIMNWLLKSAAPGLRERGRRMFASILDRSGSTEAVDKLATKLAPLEDILPVGSRKRINRIATKNVGADAPLTKELDLHYADQPSSYVPASAELSRTADDLVMTPQHVAPSGLPGGTQTVKPFIKDESLHAALKEEAERLGDAQRKAVSYNQFGTNVPAGSPAVTLRDVRTMRKQLGKEASYAGAYNASPAESVKAEAKKDAQRALANVLHVDTGSVPGKPGRAEIVDKLWSGWKTVAEKSKGRDPSVLPIRWMTARLIPGAYGTLGGAAVSAPAFWASISAKTMNRMAKLIEAGSDVEAEHLLRSIIRDYEEKEE